ncbi:hypothetical protein [Hymenobacter ruricola]|uniref:T9SS type A sorting domain-containing protein n=1 Tax=Hymenobacter ruricola TaxID=2791023 RepID=A0ABS0HYQ1_9BACT|nr:hypothetical protein [Hymenobacter ruricola]MBF9219836.1 hypothetical protein [Hymenobacter ruricola]
MNVSLRARQRLAACFFALSSLLAHHFAAAQAPPQQWDRTLGGTGNDYARGIHQLSDGGYLVAGDSDSGLTGDKSQPSHGDRDYWVIRLDAAGNKLWDRRFGGSDTDELNAVQPTADGGFLLGGTSYSGASGDRTQPSRGFADYWVVKLDANGNKLWDRAYGGSGADALTCLRQTPDGGFLLAGASDSGPGGDRSQPGQGQEDYWVLRLDATGNKLWDRAYGGPDRDEPAALEITPEGGFVVGGTSFSGIGGDKTQPARGGGDYWVVKLTPTGAKQWDQTFGGSQYDKFFALGVAANSGYLLGGGSFSDRDGDKTQPNQGMEDFWVVKLEANGTRQWDRTLGGNAYDELHDLRPTPDGGWVLGGGSRSVASGDKSQPSRGVYDFWVVKLDHAGATQWEKTLGGNSYDELAALQPTADGGYVLAGYAASGISGEKSQASRGGGDFWVVKLGSVVAGTAAAASTATLQAYPNPARVRFRLPLPATAPRTGLQLTLLDATGRTVFTQALPTTPGSEVTVEPGAQPPGLYLLRLVGPAGYLATQRLQLH